MEKLTAAQQQQIEKMSNDHLRVKLMAAGYEEYVVLGYERDDLMSLYADVLSSSKPKAGPVGYDPELEREKLAFEKAKWQTEQRRWEGEMEERKRKEETKGEERKRREERQFEEKKRKEEMEFEEKKLEFEECKHREALEAEQLELKKQELARQIDRDKAEDDRRDSLVANGKIFGDATRASTIRMGADPIDAIPFFSQR